MTDTDHKLSHPAKYTDSIMEVLARYLADAPGPILDPFAGTGRIHQLGREDTVGVELEPEWATMVHDYVASGRTVVGDSQKLTDLFEPGTFGTVATSPCYANRMGDTYDGRDGSARLTYTTALGRALTEGNAGAMQWDSEYRVLHKIVYSQIAKVLKPLGLLLLNMKDHRRDGVRQYVTQWHLKTLIELGFQFETAETIECPGNGHGANLADRITYETLLVMRAPGPQLSIFGEL